MLFLKSGWRCDTWRKCSIPGLGIAMGSLGHIRADRRGRQLPLGGDEMSWADLETRIKNKITNQEYASSVVWIVETLRRPLTFCDIVIIWFGEARYEYLSWAVESKTVSVKRTSGHSPVLPINTCCDIDSMIFAVILLLRVLCDDSVLKYTFYLIYTRLTIYSTIA